MVRKILLSLLLAILVVEVASADEEHSANEVMPGPRHHNHLISERTEVHVVVEVMSDRANAYRRGADDRERAAVRVSDPKVQAAYRDMARQWRGLRIGPTPSNCVAREPFQIVEPWRLKTARFLERHITKI
jgi:hypothetical protein